MRGRWFHLCDNHLLEEVFFVEKHEHGCFRENRITRHLLEQVERLVHPIYGVVFEQNLPAGEEEKQKRVKECQTINEAKEDKSGLMELGGVQRVYHIVHKVRENTHHLPLAITAFLLLSVTADVDNIRSTQNFRISLQTSNLTTYAPILKSLDRPLGRALWSWLYSNGSTLLIEAKTTVPMYPPDNLDIYAHVAPSHPWASSVTATEDHH